MLVTGWRLPEKERQTEGERTVPTYVYEIISPDSGAEPRRFEVFQRMSDEPLSLDPASGQPVKRIVTGGVGIKLQGLKRSTVVNKKSAAATACGCATGRPHRHVASTKSDRGHNH